MVKEKVYSVFNYWDMIILEGIADYNGNPHYYESLFPKKQDDWTGEYLLTPLPIDVFTIGKEIWSYWLHWVETCEKTKIPHPVNYAKEREIKSFEELLTTDMNIEGWRQAEQNYQNDLIFNNFLKLNRPTIKVKGLFSENGTATFVEWTK